MIGVVGLLGACGMVLALTATAAVTTPAWTFAAFGCVDRRFAFARDVVAAGDGSDGLTRFGRSAGGGWALFTRLPRFARLPRLTGLALFTRLALRLLPRLARLTRFALLLRLALLLL